MKICPVCSREFPNERTTCPDDAASLVALDTGAKTRPEELVGQTVDGRYKVERIIGKGGMGTVYACRHVVVGKLAAMKVLKPGVERSEGVLQRFIREAQTANLLKSRHIVEMTDFGQLTNGCFFVVMELLEGEDLTRAMRSGRLSRNDLLHVFIQVAEALAVAHVKGLVHRDLKPDNVFLVKDEGDPLFVKLLDFGIAKILHGEGSNFTETGVILGTPDYMSPEQARAEPVDHRTDVYALGVMMYRAFTGKLPFVADSTMGVLTRHLTEAPLPPSTLTKIDVEVERIILRCMEKLPEARFQSMRDVAASLVGAMDARTAFRDDATSDARGPASAIDPRYVSAMARTPPAMSASGGSYPRTASNAPPVVGGELATGRGFATTSRHTLSKGTSPWMIVGAFAMVGAGAAAAFGVYGKMHGDAVSGGSPSATAASMPAPSMPSSAASRVASAGRAAPERLLRRSGADHGRRAPSRARSLGVGEGERQRLAARAAATRAAAAPAASTRAPEEAPADRHSKPVRLKMRLLPLAIAASFFVLAPAAARAQRKPPPPPPKAVDPGTAQAKRLFDDGAAAYAKGNYEEAIHLWEQSYELSRRPLIFESIANAYERLGDPRKARDYLIRWREAAPRDEWDLLDDRIKNLDARVKREDQLEAERRAEEERARKAQATREEAIRVAAAPKDTGAPLPALVLMGVGGAAVAVGLTFDAIAGIRRPDAKTACAPTQSGTELCRSDDASAIKSSNTFATVGDVTWIAGAVVGAAGTVWFFTKRRAPAADTTSITPIVGPRGAALSLSRSFVSGSARATARGARIVLCGTVTSGLGPPLESGNHPCGRVRFARILSVRSSSLA